MRLSARLSRRLQLRTFFSADEYWQSLEVAHRLVFGRVPFPPLLPFPLTQPGSYGQLTWEWRAGLRGWTHVLPFAALYETLKLLGLDNPALLVLAPRLQQALSAAACDLATARLAQRLYGSPAAARVALGLSLSSWCLFYAGGRTFAGSLETHLLALCLACWPSPAAAGSQPRAAAALGALALAVRPTAALLLAPLAGLHLAATAAPGAELRRLLRLCGPPVALVLLGSLLTDRLCSGAWALPLLAFLRFNLLRSGGVNAAAAAFGAHPWHWYAWAGAPAALGLHLAPLLLALRSQAAGQRAVLAGAMLAAVGALSAAPHKEFRFLLPLLPGAHALAAGWLATGRRARPYLIAATLLHAPPALYLSLAHQAAPAPAMALLAAQARSGAVGPGGILLLTPCHETPGYSHLHAPVPLLGLDCSPSGLPTERDAFFADPAGQLPALLAPRSWSGATLGAGGVTWAERMGTAAAPEGQPSHVVLFDDVEAVVRPQLVAAGYARMASLFNAHVGGDREQRRLAVYVLQ